MNVRWRWGAALLVVAVALMWAWLRPAPVEPRRAAKEEVLPTMQGAGASAESPLPASVALKAATPAAQASPGVELCGLGRVAMPDVSRRQREERLQQIVEASGLGARRAALRALLASADETARAAGLLLQSMGFALPQDTLACDGDDCQARSAQASERVLRLQRDAATAVPALVALAQTTRSPQVYALARQACKMPDEGPAASACLALSVQRWADLAPDNALPWLELAAQDSAQGDAAGLESAMNHAAQAGAYRSDFGRLIALTLAHLPADVQGWPRLEVATAAMGVEAAAAQSGYSTLVRYCSVESVDDANRRQICARLAAGLLDRGETLLDLGVGARLAERAGLPERRIAETRAEMKRLDAAVARQLLVFIPAEVQTGCAGVDATLGYLRELGRDGELKTLRRAARAEAAAKP